MSDASTPGDAHDRASQAAAAGGAGEAQPTEEELRAYLGQLRGAPAEQVVAEVVSALLNAAQVKLGRHDARLLLDLAATTTDMASSHLPEAFTKQVEDVLAQLRLAQVEAEREVSAQAAQGREEPNDLTRSPSDAEPAAATGTSAPPGPEQPPGGSRLWVPGR